MNHFIVLLLALGIAFSQQDTLRINEVMSANRTFLNDRDGDYPDWIELFNGGLDSVATDGFFLSDDRDLPLKWRLPSLTLAPDSFLLVLASGKSAQNKTLFFDRLIGWGDTCRYRQVTYDIGNSWKETGFNDDAWLSGPTGVGYGDGDDASVVSPVRTVYLRLPFQINYPDSLAALYLHIDYDDAFVAYINGTEVARANIGEPGETVTFDQWANTGREAQLYSGGRAERYELDMSALQNGQNMLAIEVHNFGENSSDMSCIPFLSAGYTSEAFVSETPQPQAWLPQVEWHANFKVNSGSETLYLSGSSGLVDSMAVPALAADESFGLLPDGSENRGIFVQPTPAAANMGPHYAGRAPDISASPVGGFFVTAPRVYLQADSGFAIRYTLDGSTPHENSALYETPFRIQNTTVLRARAFAPGYVPGDVFSATYFINENHDLPVISLATEPANLFDEQTGIYMHGPDAQPSVPYFGANFWKDIEVPVTLEMFEKDGSPAWNAQAGIKIMGGWSRAHPQKSLAVFFRSAYGAGDLDYPLFGAKGIDRFEAFVLRNGGNDWESTLLRDPLMHSLASRMDIDHLAYRPVVLYINGEYWGIHNLREKANEHYFAGHYNIDPDSIDLLENDKFVIHGSADAYRSMLDYLRTTDMTREEAFPPLAGMMDVDSYIDYTLLQLFGANTDWPGNNIKYWRPQHEDGRFRWLLFDTDFSFGLYSGSTYDKNMMDFALQENGPNWPNPAWSTELFRLITQNPQFRRRFSNRAVVHLNRNLGGPHVLALLDSLQNKIATEIGRHHQRWNRDFGIWQWGISVMREFAEYRSPYLLAHIMLEFNLTSGPMLNVLAPAQGGRVFVEGVDVSGSDFKAPFFNEQDVELQAKPDPGYNFSGWEGHASSQSNIFVRPQGQSLKALFTKTETPAIVINEINYNSHPDFECEDWLELLNAGNEQVDLSGWVFKDSDDQHAFVLPQGTSLAAGEYLVLSRDTLAFRSFFSDPDITLLGPVEFGFDGAGELLRLFDATLALVDSVRYDDKSPWPLSPDGDGATLELINPAKDNALAQSWAASAGNGSPGVQNTVYTHIENDVANYPLQFELKPNYPNPFNPQTRIAFGLARAANVHLAVYDVLGREIAVLVNGNMTAGWHTADFIAHNNASGLYFYQMKIDGKAVAVKKMLLIR